MASEQARTAKGQDADDQEHLLSQSRDTSPESDIVVEPAYLEDAQGAPQPRRQSSFAQPRPQGAPPRTTNRVHFEIEDSIRGSHDDGDDNLIEEEDYLTADDWNSRRHNAGQRAPLLTGIEAPAVTVAESDFNPDDLLESARPKSTMSSAFMNMANSIMCV